MELLLISLVLLACLCIVLLFKQFSFSFSARESQSMLLTQQQIDSLRRDLRGSLQHITENVSQHLSMVTSQIQSQTSGAGTHLDNAQKKYEETNKRLSGFEIRLTSLTDHRLTEDAPTPHQILDHEHLIL